MSVINSLASSLGRKDEIPNQELALKIVSTGDKTAINELVENLNNKNKEIQSDCIKVLYEIGMQKPALIAGHTKVFLLLLESKSNRLQWGAMIALDYITDVAAESIYSNLVNIVEASDKGSVITKDHAVNILIKLCRNESYAKRAFPLLAEQMLTCPTNQLPKYAEDALPLINNTNKKTFIKTISARLPEIEKESKKKRIEKVLRKLA